MAESRLKNVNDEEIDTILAEDIDFTGKLKFAKPLMIRGKLRGEIFTASDLYIEEHSDVKAQIEAGKVSIKGSLEGNINAEHRVELFSTAVLKGDVNTPDIVMESGCYFNGRCHMKNRNKNPKEHREGETAK